MTRTIKVLARVRACESRDRYERLRWREVCTCKGFFSKFLPSSSARALTKKSPFHKPTTIPIPTSKPNPNIWAYQAEVSMNRGREREREREREKGLLTSEMIISQ